MSRFLAATMPIVGHVAPLAAVVRTLVARGHDVVWYGSSFFRQRIEATGARFELIRSSVDYGDADLNGRFPERTQYAGLKQVVWDFEHLFVGSIPGYVEDLRRIIAEFHPDVLIGDPAVIAVHIIEHVDGVPAATVNVSVLAIDAPDVPPLGLGAGPGHNLVTRLRNRVLYLLVDHVIFRSVNKAYYELADRNGWPRFPVRPRATRALYLQPSVPELEYPDSRRQPQVHFIGALLPPPGAFDPPDWWQDVIAARAVGRPVVVVTQGTIATDASELIRPALAALADRDVLVVAAGADPESIPDLPRNARVATFVPFTQLLPLADAYVTNGGYGGLMIALSNGLPVVTAGTTEDKADVGARVRRAGVGINLRTNRPSPEKLKSAIDAVLDQPKYRAAAERIKARLDELDAPTRAAELLEELAATKQPVVRPAGSGH
jgi:UDP:flavonoid glycosyltransferase YjiC (YdhE family)